MYLPFCLYQNTEDKGDAKVPKPPILHLSSANVDSHGAYIMDTFDHIFMYVGKTVSEKFIQDVLDQPNFMSIPEGMVSNWDLYDMVKVISNNAVCHFIVTPF